MLFTVNVSFYDINGSILDVRWVPNSHYSGMHGLLKLVFPKVLPSSVTNKLIVIDTDLTFTSDIFELWQLFEKFSHKQVSSSFFFLTSSTHCVN